jgi:hypothetical protein
MSTKLKKTVVIAASLTIGLATVVIFLSVNRTSPLTQENLKRIEVGMTPKEVTAILGVGPGDYSNCQMIFYEDGDKENFDTWADLAEGAGLCWIDHTGSLCVGLDENGRVDR